MGVLGSLISGGMNLIGAGIAARRNKVAQGQLDGIQSQNTGIIDQFDTTYGGTFGPSTARATGGANMYADATGVNGQDGYDRATQSFRTNPGYDFSLGQQQQATERGAAAGGMIASGNLLDQLSRNAAGYADQAWQSHVTNLAPWVGQEQAGLENGVALGSLVSTARLENNAQRAEGLQSGINGRQTAIGGALANAGSAFGNAAGYSSYMKPTQPATGGGVFQRIGAAFGRGS